MPEFEFKCSECGAISTFNKREEAESCPNCGSRRLARIFAAPHIVKSRPEAGGKTLCYGRDSRPGGCTPGSCCHSDGAKESCALKISTAAVEAVRAGYMAFRGLHLKAGTGIIGNSLEDTLGLIKRIAAEGLGEVYYYLSKVDYLRSAN